MSQEDVRVNVAPSITTLNQTPAQISLVEEISIDNGAAAIDTNFNSHFQGRNMGRQSLLLLRFMIPNIPKMEGILLP